MHKSLRVTLVALVALCLHTFGCASSETDTTAGPGSSSSGTAGGGGASCEPAPEICDGVDNDCDMEVDEGCECLSGETQDCYTGPPGTQGVGICAGGTQTCNPATNTFGPCANDTTPASAETCNGLDDDCNGSVDEGFPDLVCGVGSCLVLAPACVDGMPGTCVPGMPSLEVCDGVDNDCDQLVDESYAGQGAACVTGIPGICADGTIQCEEGTATCVPTLTPLNEICDGLDNDCNGVLDDNVLGTGGDCGTGMPGVCGPGTISCQGNQIDCFPIIAPSGEVCDGLDNDCNGQMDEGDPGGGGACNTGLQGVCGVGLLACQNGAVECLEIATPASETCDGLDNNCDGQVDEGDPGAGVACGCGGTKACLGGELLCEGSAVGCLFQQNFDAGCPVPGWTLGGDWQCGTPTGAGPGGAFSAPNCLGTQLAGPYNASQSFDIAIAQAPPIDLTTANEPVLRFQMWAHTESTYDGVNLKVSTDGGATFTQLTTVTPAYNNTAGGQQVWGNSTVSPWQPYEADLTAYVGQTILLRWSFRSDGSVQNPGVYVDNVQVVEAEVIMITTASPLPPVLVGSPYQVLLQTVGGTGSPLAWSIVAGTNHAWLSLNPTTGLLTGTPAAPDAGPYSITVHVEETLLPSNFHEVTLTGQVRHIVSTEGFEGLCPNGWALTGDWQCGTPSVVGPSAAFAGTQCIATQIAGTYNNNQTFAGTTATSPPISLAGTTSPQLSFRVWMNTEGSIYDGFNLKVSTNGVTYTQVLSVAPGYNLTIAGEQVWGGDQSGLGWQIYTANLAAYAGQTVNLRFAFRSDGSVVRPGVYIDEVSIID